MHHLPPPLAERCTLHAHGLPLVTVLQDTKEDVGHCAVLRGQRNPGKTPPLARESSLEAWQLADHLLLHVTGRQPPLPLCRTNQRECRRRAAHSDVCEVLLVVILLVLRSSRLLRFVSAQWPRALHAHCQRTRYLIPRYGSSRRPNSWMGKPSSCMRAHRSVTHSTGLRCELSQPCKLPTAHGSNAWDAGTAGMHAMGLD